MGKLIVTPEEFRKVTRLLADMGYDPRNCAWYEPADWWAWLLSLELR